MLEAAFIFLPLLMIFFGIIDISVAIFMKNTMQFAVREGVRYAITGQTVSGYGQLDSIKQVVQRNGMGFLSGTTGLNRISVTFYDPSSTPPLQTVTGTGSNSAGNVVQVAVTGLSWAWMAPVGHSGTGPLSISAASSDVMEAPPNGVLPTL